MNEWQTPFSKPSCGDFQYSIKCVWTHKEWLPYFLAPKCHTIVWTRWLSLRGSPKLVIQSTLTQFRVTGMHILSPLLRTLLAPSHIVNFFFSQILARRWLIQEPSFSSPWQGQILLWLFIESLNPLFCSPCHGCIFHICLYKYLTNSYFLHWITSSRQGMFLVLITIIFSAPRTISGT